MGIGFKQQTVKVPFRRGRSTHKGRNAQIDPKRGYIVQALRFRADEGVCPLGYIGPYGTSFTLQVLILPILLTKADTYINNSEAVSADYTNKAGEGH